MLIKVSSSVGILIVLVVKNCFMPILYVRTGCPFCARVLDAGEELGITFEERNVADEGVVDELIARGGEPQVPYLVDEENDIEMYESDAIVAYLQEQFSSESVT